MFFLMFPATQGKSTHCLGCRENIKMESIVLGFHVDRVSEKKRHALHKDAFVIEGADVSEMIYTHAVESLVTTQG